MNIHCPHCESVFRVDPDRLPATAVRVRCPRCADVFALSRQGVAAPARAYAGAAESAGATDGSPATRAAPAAEAPIPSTASPATEKTATSTAPAPGSFRTQDPDTRAQRIARALVSDIVAYNRERRDQALAAGRLRGEFRDEILKSWEEYVEQVGAQMAKNTPHFRSALNDILASGQKVF